MDQNSHIPYGKEGPTEPASGTTSPGCGGSRTLKLEPRTRYCDCHCVGELTNPTRDSTPSRPWLRRLNTFPKSCKEGVKWDLSPNQLLKSSVLFIIHPWKEPWPFSVYREKSTFSRKLLLLEELLKALPPGGATTQQLTSQGFHAAVQTGRMSSLRLVPYWLDPAVLSWFVNKGTRTLT